MLNNINHLLLIIFVFFAIFLGIILIFKSGQKRPTILLGLFIIAYSANDIFILGEFLLPETLSSRLLFFPFFYGNFLIGPLLYLYSKNLLTPISWKQEKIHLLPGLIEFLFFTVLFFFPVETKQWIEDSEAMSVYWFFLRIIVFSYTIFYIYKTYKFIEKCEYNIQNFYSSLEGKLLLWIKYIAVFLGTLLFIWIGSNTLVRIMNEHYDNLFLPYFSLLLDVANLCFIVYATVMGLKQVALLEFAQMKLEELKYSESENIIVNHTSARETNRLYEGILEYMKEKEPFTDSNLTLASLASELNIQSRKLSAVIKQESSYNFNQFINNLRVEKAKELLISHQYGHYTILGIAEEAGFNSKATFNTSFKQFAKMIPSQYKKEFQK